jgi:hypothetical protein
LAYAAIVCDSPLLKKALEKMIKTRLAPLNRCDLAISDKPLAIDKPTLVIGDHIPKPFSRERLFSAIAFFERLEALKNASIEALNQNDRRGKEERISALTNRYAKDLLQILSAK